MKTLGILLISVIVLLQAVSALEFPEDTTFTQDNIKYTFKKGINLDFKLISGGILIEDNHRMYYGIQGGNLEIIFYHWEEEDYVMGMISSVPQRVDFSITIDGKEQYVYDGKEYYIGSINIDTDEIHWTYLTLEEDDPVKNSFDSTDFVPSDSWFSEKLFFFEVPELNYNDKTIGGKIVNITNLTTLLSLLAIFALVIVWWLISKK